MTPTPARTRHIGVGTFQVSDKMRQLVSQVLDSGRISYGPMSLEFEQRFSRMHGCEYGILSNSGTSSLQVALQAMKELYGWADGDEVIVPAMTFVASANIVIHNRMVPIFVDIDPVTYNINPDLIEKSLTPRTRAIVAVHLFGQPANMTAINDIANRHGLMVIEDSCETMLATHAGKVVGSMGDVAAFSFYSSHILVTGVGGISTTNNPDIAGKMRSLTNHGLTLDCLDAGVNFSPRPVPNRSFRFESVGHSFRITELESALGLAQLDDLEQYIAIRRRNANHMIAGLSAVNSHYKDVFQLPQTASDNTHSWMMFVTVLKEGNRESLIRHLGECGIETRDAVPLLSQPAYSYVNKRRFPVATYMLDHAFYTGLHHLLTPEDIRYVVDCFGVWSDSEYPGITK